MICYEWTKEEVEDGDVLECDFSDTLDFFKENLPNAVEQGEDGIHIGLYIRDYKNGVCTSFWAYLEKKDGKWSLPDEAYSANNKKKPVPAKYKAELDKVLTLI
jgi:hypothetical protein